MAGSAASSLAVGGLGADSSGPPYDRVSAAAAVGTTNRLGGLARAIWSAELKNDKNAATADAVGDVFVGDFKNSVRVQRRAGFVRTRRRSRLPPSIATPAPTTPSTATVDGSGTTWNA